MTAFLFISRQKGERGMKKILVLVLCLLVLEGCGSNKTEETVALGFSGAFKFIFANIGERIRSGEDGKSFGLDFLKSDSGKSFILETFFLWFCWYTRLFPLLKYQSKDILCRYKEHKAQQYHKAHRVNKSLELLRHGLSCYHLNKDKQQPAAVKRGERQ